MWSIVGIITWDTNVSPQTLQWEPWVKPVEVQVAFTASSITSMCPEASIVSVYEWPQWQV